MSTPRSEFAEHLRELDESELLELLSARPDLMSPPPSDFDALAARASTATSVRLAARGLDHFTLTVLHVLHENASTSLAAQSTVAERLEQLLGETAPELALRRAYITLARLALIWAHGDGWRATGELDVDTTHRATRGHVLAHPPELPTIAVDPISIDQAGAGSAAELIRLTEQLLHTCSQQPIEQLRTGGVSTKEMRRLASVLNAEPRTIAILLELSFAAGLLALDDGPTATWLPTVVFDHWRSDTAGQRWTSLARTWLTMRRQPSLIEQRDSKTRRIASLSAEVSRTSAPWLREQLLSCFEQLPAGSVTPPAAVQERLHWTAPLRISDEETAPDGSRVETVGSLIGEAATLGLLGVAGAAGQGYGLTSFGRELLRGKDPAPTLSALLPEPVDHVLVQADLTVIAPGPLIERLAQAMGLVAQVESAGSATVYRVTPQSLRHAFDAGWTRDDVQRFFVDSSATPIPQALSYLIDDTARRHGGLRAGAAAAYLRSDDESLIAAVLSDPRCTELRLRGLAPTVAVTPCAPQTLVGLLRTAGYAAATEDASGALVVRSSQQRRVAHSPRAGSDPHTATRTNEQLHRDAWHAIERLRSGEERRRVLQRIAKLDTGSGPELGIGAGSEAMVGLIGECITEKRQLWIRFVDAHGGIQRRLVRPLALGDGYLRAEDERNETSHTLALHRIASATLPD